MAVKSGHGEIVRLLQPASEPIELESVEQPARTLATSNFKQLYTQVGVINAHAIIIAANELVHSFTARRMTPDDAAAAALSSHLRGHLTHAALADQTYTAEMALRMWTCPVAVHGVELCYMINDTLRRDISGEVDRAVTLTVAINRYLMGNTEQGWPLDGLTFRGGGLPAVHRPFFTVGKRYRAQAFVSSSFRQQVAQGFIERADSGEPILWTLQFARGCKHAALVARHSALHQEKEFLVAPYTAFEVMSVVWSDQPTSTRPHQIRIKVATDNALEPEDLPLAPWS